MFGAVVVLYGLQCQSGQCPQIVQISPVVASPVVIGEIYRPNPLKRVLRKRGPVYAVPVLILPAETKKDEVK